jgi:TonB family protein
VSYASSRIYRCFCILTAISVVLLPAETYCRQEATSDASDQAIASIARSLVDPITKLKVKSILVLDLKAPDGHLHPIGTWISDRLSLALQKELSDVRVIDRAQLNPKGELPGGPVDDTEGFRRDLKAARSQKADIFITGDFAGVVGQIGISLTMAKLSQLDKPRVERTGLIPISSKITNLTNAAIPSLKLEDGLPRAGKGGISSPVCTHCPGPEPRGRRNGLVKLKVIVSQEGRPQSIHVVESPNYDLAEAAVKAIQSWQFKPALGVDGQPIDVIVPVQIDFRDYQ